MVIEELIVVLVESSAMQQKIIRARLDEVGVRHLHCASSGVEGLKLIKDLTPDLVLSAMYLDDMTGADLVLTMRRVEALSDIAFVLVSSETSFRALDPIRQAGAIALLPKPFDADDLRRALYATLDYYQSSQDQLGDFEPGDLSVLVVDDSGMARKHIMRVLGNLGIDHIDEARDGREACNMLNAHLYDLVVTDYNMPKMDGRELVEHIREHSSQRSIPVMMVTSEDDEGRLSAVQQAGVSAICDKPFEPATVRALLDGVLRESA